MRSSLFVAMPEPDCDAGLLTGFNQVRNGNARANGSGRCVNLLRASVSTAEQAGATPGIPAVRS
jgi:hypothetical protein